uniref:PQ-loop repeat-containing protein 3 n=1 Tax=Ditylenchus dipsaci TaxID=166011 RepID=A0A915CQ67_9BILA
MEIIFNVSISIITALFIQFTGAIPQTYLGQYSLVPITLDAAICCLYYVQALLNRNKNLEGAARQDTGIHLKVVSSITRSH